MASSGKTAKSPTAARASRPVTLKYLAAVLAEVVGGGDRLRPLSALSAFLKVLPPCLLPVGEAEMNCLGGVAHFEN